VVVEATEVEVVVMPAALVVVVAPLLSASSLTLRGKAKALLARAAIRIEKCIFALLFVGKVVKLNVYGGK
jgi:hypothetical protein